MKRERHSRSIENDTDTEYWSVQRSRLPSYRNTIRITNGASWYLRPLTIHVGIRFSIYEYVSRFKRHKESRTDLSRVAGEEKNRHKPRTSESTRSNWIIPPLLNTCQISRPMHARAIDFYRWKKKIAISLCPRYFPRYFSRKKYRKRYGLGALESIAGHLPI